MSEATQFTIGSDVVCSDGACGHLARVVVDPVAQSLTHLVVQPRRGRGLARLVPVALVGSASASEVRLSCTTRTFESLDDAVETEFLPGAPGDWGYAEGQMLMQPYFVGGSGVAGVPGDGMNLGAMKIPSTGGPRTTTHDRVPAGEVQVRRGEHVHAIDGVIGRVHGLVVDPADHHVTHVLLAEGHLWGQKEVAIPISDIKDVKDGIAVNLTKDQVRDLPEVGINRRD